jgi:hypothetical protein
MDGSCGKVEMLKLKQWPAAGVPPDDGFVIVLIHRASLATVLVVPPGASESDIRELDMGVQMALYRAKLEASRRGFQVIYVSPGEEVPWNPEWGILID